MKIQNNEIPVFNDASEVKLMLAEQLKGNIQINSLEEFPSPFEMLDMQKAVDVFFKAVAENRKIKCVCDSDCDGLGTYTLFYNFFKYFPYKNIEIIITNRKEGYGFIPKHIDETTGLYITADNGITAVAATDAAKAKGADVIITDHHQPDLEAGLPNADAIVDPFIPGDTFPYKDISGTFVLWFFLKAIAERSNLEMDFFEEYLPELGLTTLSDVMPLDRHLNRFVVSKFIDGISSGEIQHREYINTYRRIVNATPTAEDIAFTLTPLINATQRMATADIGALFLIQEDTDKSEEWFQYITVLNNERKQVQQRLQSFVEMNYRGYLGDNPFIVIPGEYHDSYKGVLGILAGRLADKFKKPSIVMKLNKNTMEYTGSGRSVGEVNILELLRDNPYVKNVGGHKQALGLTVTYDNFTKFYETLQEKTALIPDEVLHPKKLPFGFIPLNKLDIDMFNDLQTFEPFGKDFPRPVFVTKATVKSARLVGQQKNHLTLVVGDDVIKYKGMQFFTEWVPEKDKEYYFYFKLDLDTFGKDAGKLMLKIDDIQEIA